MCDQREELASIMPKESTVERIETGFKFAEGPLWNGSQGFLLFSDIPANRIYRWSPEEGLGVFRDPSGNSNGLTYDKKGRLLICEHGNRRLSRIEKDGAYTVLADSFRGKRLNSPNDVIVRSDGTIYFTDPPYGIQPKEKELPFSGVYRVDPEENKLTLLVDDFDRPNGLAFSPDESILYIGDSSTARRHVRAFDVTRDGTVSNGRVFVEIRSELPGNPDGIKVDTEGRLYVSAAGGIWVFSQDREHLGTVRTPEIPANCAWGDSDWRTLFITARTSIYRVKTSAQGVRTP